MRQWILKFMAVLVLLVFYTSLLAIAFTLAGCGRIVLDSEGLIKIWQGANRTPAEIKITEKKDSLTIEAKTGSNPGKSKEEIREESRAWLIYVGASLIVAALFFAWIKYPVAAGLALLGGIGLIGFHEYPWAALLLGLGGAALGIFYGYEKAEKKVFNDLNPLRSRINPKT